MKKLILLGVAISAISAGATTFETVDGFSIMLPDGWNEVSDEALETFANRSDDQSTNAFSQSYDYGYQAQSQSDQRLSYPYVLVQVRPIGRIPSSELARYQKMSEEIEEYALPDVSVGETVYDKEHQILWSSLAGHTDRGVPVKAVVAVKLTEIGYLRLMGCATEATFETYEKVFRDAFASLEIDDAIVYKPQIADAVPSVGGIKTGKVLVWIIQSAVIGGILWLLYIAIKRKLRKS